MQGSSYSATSIRLAVALKSRQWQSSGPNKWGSKASLTNGAASLTSRAATQASEAASLTSGATKQA